MSSYDSIVIETNNDYEQLNEVLDKEFNPKEIAKDLKSQITSKVKTLLVEHGYVDKDYRSTFYNFYAEKGRKYRADCVRVHFFDDKVSYDEAKTDIIANDGRLQDHYFGYIVLRPTIEATLGRSVLSPDIRKDARGRAIQSVHTVNLLGHQLRVWGFPSMSQHADISVCAHVACWAILRHYSETFSQHREYLIHDITRMAAPFDPGGLVPSLGLNETEAERILHAAGCFPLLIPRMDMSDDMFYSQLMAYLESGFPLYANMPNEEHAIVVVGHSWKESATQQASPSHVWTQVETLLTVDDNYLPYATIQKGLPYAQEKGQPDYSAESFDSFIVALPDKIHYPADAIDTLSPKIEEIIMRLGTTSHKMIELRRYFIMSISKLREHAREHQSQLGDTLVEWIMRLETAQFVWVVEYCSVTQWKNRQVTARVIVDATASLIDEVPIWLLHNEDTAILYDRSSAENKRKIINLERKGLGPLSRIELNLRPINPLI